MAESQNLLESTSVANFSAKKKHLDPTSKSLEAGQSASVAYLESTLRQHVVNAVQKTLKQHPEQPLNAVVENLRDGNPSTETKIIQLPKVAEVVTNATLVSVKHKRRNTRVQERRKLPMHVVLNPAQDHMISVIGEAKKKFEDMLQKDIQDVMHGDSSSATGSTNLVSSAISRRLAAANDGVAEFGKEIAANLPQACDKIQIFSLTPLGREVVFVDGAPFIGDVALKRAARSGPSGGVGTGGEGSGSYLSAGDLGESDEEDDEWNIDNSSDESSVIMDMEPEPAEDLEQEITECVLQNNLGRRCFPMNQLQIELARSFSNTAPTSASSAAGGRHSHAAVAGSSALHGIQIAVSRLVCPGDRVQLSPSLIDQIDESLGQSDNSPLVPVIVFAFGFEQDLIVRNISAAIATTQYALIEDKQLRVNQLVDVVQTEKRRLRMQANVPGSGSGGLQSSPTGSAGSGGGGGAGTGLSQFTMNPSGYWMKVMERREARDRARDSRISEKKRQKPLPPLPSNLSERDREIQEADRAKAAQEREVYLKELDHRVHLARLARQARRSREDTDAADAITKTFASGAVLVQSMIRGFLTRRRLQTKNLRRKSFREIMDEPMSPASRNRVVERYAKHANEGKHRNRISSTIPWAIESDVLVGLCQEFPEGICNLVPRAPNKSKDYKTWLPERTRVPPAHDDDVSSEDEAWICTTRIIHPKPQTERYRMVNPYAKTQIQLQLAKCDLDDYLLTCDTHFTKVSPLHRRAFAAIQAKCIHMLHTAYLDLLRRNQLPKSPAEVARSPYSIPHNAQWTFSRFVDHYRPELDSWFNMPHLVSRCLYEVKQRQLALCGSNASVNMLEESIPAPMPVSFNTSNNNNNNATSGSGSGSLTGTATFANSQNQNVSSSSSHHSAGAINCVPIMSTHYIAFEDLNAGEHWASTAEMTKMQTGKLTGGVVAGYLRGEGCVQLGPTRVFLVSDTMKAPQIHTCIQAMTESLKCNNLRWIQTSPFATSYVHGRPVFAVSYSEHLAKSASVFRNVSQVMLEGKLNPLAQEKRAQLAAERLLAQKQAALGIVPSGSLRPGGGDGSASGSPTGGSGASVSGSSRTASNALRSARSGFVGRTAGSRLRQAAAAKAEEQEKETGTNATSSAEDNVTSSSSMSKPTVSAMSTSSHQQSQHRTSIATTTSLLSAATSEGVFSSSPTVSTSSSSTSTHHHSKKDEEPNYGINYKAPTINDKLSVEHRKFANNHLFEKKDSNVHASSHHHGSHHQHGATHITSGGISLRSNSPAAISTATHHPTSFVNTHPAAMNTSNNNNNNTESSSTSQYNNNNNNNNNASSSALSSQNNSQKSDNHPSSITSHLIGSSVNLRDLALHTSFFDTTLQAASSSANLLAARDKMWFGTSWTDLDSRFSNELIHHVKDEQGVLKVLIPVKGFEDPQPKPIEATSFSDGSPNNNNSTAASSFNLALGQSMNSVKRPSQEPVVDEEEEETGGGGATGGSVKSARSPRHSNANVKKKKPPSMQLRLIGEFPKRVAGEFMAPDVRSFFRTLNAREISIQVTVPLKKVNSMLSSNQSQGGGGGTRSGMTSALGGVTIGGSTSQNLTGGMMGAASGVGFNRGQSTVGAGVRLGGGDSRGPRSQSRMVRSMSRVTAASMPGMTSASGSRRYTTGDGDDEEDGIPETPPPAAETLIATPEATFKKIFSSYNFNDASFVRFPTISLGGHPWLESIEELIRSSYLHMNKGGPDDVCTVVSVSTGDDIFYAIVVALVHALLFAEETLGSKARKFAAQKAREGATSIVAAAQGEFGLSGSNKNRKNKKKKAGGATTAFFEDPDNKDASESGSGSGSVKFASCSEPKKDHIAMLSTGLDKKASRRFVTTVKPPTEEEEEFLAPIPSPEEVEAFACIHKFVESHEQDSVDLQHAAVELDCMIHKCGLWTTFKMPVIEARNKAMKARGSLDVRQHIREACCGLERYLWLLAITRCLMDYRASNPAKFDSDHDSSFTGGSASLSVQKNQETPRLTDFIEWRLGKTFFNFLRDGIDPWSERPKTSPDPTHMKLYSMYPQRWFRAYFTPSVI